MKTLASSFALCAVMMSASSLAQAAIYDASADFQASNNAIGNVWSYGYSPSATGYAMTLFDTSTGGNTWNKSGYITLGTPSIWKNTSGSTLYGVNPGQIALHPGPVANGDFTILRFTAPTSANYTVTGQFFAGDRRSMNGSIVLNGNLANPLQYFSSTTDTSFFSPLSLALTNGQTLDFVVGNNGDFYYGNTPVSVSISSSPVPVPAAAWLLGSGLLGLVGVAGRKAA